MRNARDTFLHFLADNLALVDIPVHALRRDKDRPDANTIQNNAINVQFLNTNLDTEIIQTNVSIDVVHDNELTAIDWMTTLWTILSASFMIPELDYSNPSTPVATGTNIFWGRKAVRFHEVVDDFFYRYNATFLLHYHDATPLDSRLTTP